MLTTTFIILHSVMSFFTPRDIRIGLIDGIKLAEDSVPFRDAKSKIDKELNHYDQHAKAAHDTLANKFIDLEKQKAIIPDYEYKKKEKNLRHEAEKQHEKFTNKRERIDQMAETLQEKMAYYVKEIVQDISVLKKIDIVFEKSGTVYNNNKLDITKYVVHRLNKDFVEISLE